MIYIDDTILHILIFKQDQNKTCFYFFLNSFTDNL